MRLRRRDVLLAQGAYYAATGVAPFASRRAFEAVTGPKLEWWLVQTVGALVTVVGAGLASAAAAGRDTPEIRGMAAGCAVAFAGVEVVYVARGRISPVYLADAVVQAGLLGAGLAAREAADGVGREAAARAAEVGTGGEVGAEAPGGPRGGGAGA